MSSVGAPRSRQRNRRLRRSFAVIAVVLVLAYLTATLAARSAAIMHPTLTSVWPEPPLVIAHQGGDGLWPSATRLAFRGAAELGADVLEMDVRLSRDGRLVVIHDATVDRTTGGSGAVLDFSADELGALDAAADWSPGRRGESFPYRGGGEELGVPRLTEVLADHPDAPLLIEIKPAEPAAALAVCTRLRSEGRALDAVVASFHASAMRAFRGACPEVATSATPDEVRTFVVLSRLRLAGPYRPPFDALQVPEEQGGIRVVTPSLVDAAHAKDVQVHVWTIDERDDMTRLLDLGVDGLITDRPDRALAVLGRPVPEGVVPPCVAP